MGTGGREVRSGSAVSSRGLTRAHCSTTLTLMDAMHELFVQVIRGGMAGDQCIEIAVGIDIRETLLARALVAASATRIVRTSSRNMAASVSVS